MAGSDGCRWRRVGEAPQGGVGNGSSFHGAWIPKGLQPVEGTLTLNECEMGRFGGKGMMQSDLKNFALGAEEQCNLM